MCFSFTWWLQTEPCGRDGGSGWARSAGVPTTSRASWTHNLLEERRHQPGWQRRTNYSKRWLWLMQFICVFRMTSYSREFKEIIFLFSWYQCIYVTHLVWPVRTGLPVLWHIITTRFPCNINYGSFCVDVHMICMHSCYLLGILSSLVCNSSPCSKDRLTLTRPWLWHAG